MKVKSVLLLIGVATALAAFWPGAAGAATLRGVVVARSHGTLLVASANGSVRSMRGSAQVGARLEGSRVVGHASHARIRGVVVKRVGSTMFLSSNRHLLAVKAQAPPSNSIAPGSVAPGPGSVVSTTVAVQPSGELDEENESQVGQVSGNVQVQATITAVGAGTVTVSVNGQSVTVNLPNGLTLPASVVGQTVTFGVSLNGNDNQGDDDNGDNGGGGDD